MHGIDSYLLDNYARTMGEPLAKSLPLASAQGHIWLQSQISPVGTYNTGHIWRLTGPVDPQRLEHALEVVIGRHEILRTRIVVVSGVPYQIIDAAPSSCFVVIDSPSTEAAAIAIAESEIARSFDLSMEHPIRVHLNHYSPQLWLLSLSIHHSAVDRASLNLVLAELSDVYNGRLFPRESGLPQFQDFVREEQAYLQSDAFSAGLAYWSRTCGPLTQETTPNFDCDGTATTEHHVSSISRDLTMLETETFDRIAASNECSRFMLLVALMARSLAQRYFLPYICIGYPSVNRVPAQRRRIVGCMTNMLPIVISCSAADSMGQLVGSVKQHLLDAQPHQDVPFAYIVRELRPQRDASKTPLFQVTVVDNTRQQESVRLNGVSIQRLQRTSTASRFDLTLEALDVDSNVRLRWLFRQNTFKESTIAQLGASIYDYAIKARIGLCAK